MVTVVRSAVGIAAIWLAAVAGVSATAWVAIDRAGRDITSTSLRTLPPAPLVTPTLGSEPAVTASTAEPSSAGRPTTVPSPVATATTTPTLAPTAPTASTAPTAQDQTISVPGGLVSVRCAGATIALRVAQPENDWRVNVDTPGGQQIVVSFRGNEENPDSRTAVSAVCTNGTPVFTVRNG
jgi:hypothetical protein